ncbi:carbohydrate kinase, FGGY family protein [Ancylostoma caninum]|uniref:Carbohydrate kinase, FGGY family protein n=1 Tax=Ancylostoma caninum TaxID=29170 RepID=A0A368G762_ANCCA|nr:carbohydrate kinase, FGGY family protein [Ancylostoma caninum]
MCSLGIDLGTTTIKVCVVQGTKIITESQVRHNANIANRVGVQDARKIITEAETLLRDVIGRVRTEFSMDVSRIGISGQQHGLVLWNSDALRRGKLDCSELYNWMYPGDPAAATKLPKSTSSCVFPGYGMRTLCELASYPTFDPEKHWDRCGNIMDYLACYLTGSDEVRMSEHNAYAWGYSTGLQWNPEILPFTPEWIRLPTIVQTFVGKFEKLGDCRLEQLRNIPVGVAFADLHASIMSVRGHYTGADHAYLILGTSSQLCFVLPSTAKLPALPVTTHVFPFSDGLTLIAAASMNGGNALDAFLSTLRRWSVDAMREEVSSYDMSRILDEVDRASSTTSPNRIPTIKPLFINERGSEDEGVEINGLTKDTSLNEMLIGVCRGVIHNLFSLVPPELFVSYGVKKLFLVGSAKQDRFLVHIKNYLKEHGACHLEMESAVTNTSAAYGIAL